MYRTTSIKQDRRSRSCSINCSDNVRWVVSACHIYIHLLRPKPQVARIGDSHGGYRSSRFPERFKADKGEDEESESSEPEGCEEDIDEDDVYEDENRNESTDETGKRRV